MVLVQAEMSLREEISKKVIDGLFEMAMDETMHPALRLEVLKLIVEMMEKTVAERMD